MDEFVRKAAALGLPAIMLVIVMATTGLAGAAASKDEQDLRASSICR